MESKFRLSPMIASQLSQRLEDKDRKQKEGMITRGIAAKNNEKQEKVKIGPPSKKREGENKKVAFTDSDEEIPRVEENAGNAPKAKALPYVDVPPLKPSIRTPVSDPVKEDQISKFGPAYKSRAPVEVGIDIEKIVEKVLDLEINVPLRNLAGVSGAVQKEIKKQVTKARIPMEIEEKTKPELVTRSRPMIRLQNIPIAMYTIMTEVSDEIPEGSFVADDPVLQYLAQNKDINPEDLVVADESAPLRSLYAIVNRVGQEECLLDNGSMIVSMSKEAAVHVGLTWDPSIRINMESASNHLEKTLGLARNVRFSVAGISVFLQVHILENPPYRVLLGRPFETFTSCVTKTKMDGSSELMLTDPNTKTVAIVPTYRRGCGPEELQKQHYQGF